MRLTTIMCLLAVMYIFNFNTTLTQTYVPALIPCMVDTASLAGRLQLPRFACFGTTHYYISLLQCNPLSQPIVTTHIAVLHDQLVGLVHKLLPCLGLCASGLLDMLDGLGGEPLDPRPCRCTTVCCCFCALSSSLFLLYTT